MTHELEDLIRRATITDGVPPFSDPALLQLAVGDRELVWETDETGRRIAAALDSRTAAEFVVDPDARGHGHGARMLDMLTHPSRGGGGTAKLFWAHGDHPGARALARHHKLETVRTLLHLAAPVATPATAIEPVDSFELRPFRPTDAPALIALNGRAFASHPVRGALTADDFERATAEPWFDPDDLLLAFDGEDLIGICWLKLAAATRGELYLVAVDPVRRGAGVGGSLVTAAFERLVERRIDGAHLYVDSDNEPALRLYDRFGFVEIGVDIQYHYIR